jgi:S1-C subfamily serine protease
LRLAIDAYLAGREEHKPSAPWLGINAVALLSRPEAPAIDPAARDKARQLAREVQEEVAGQPKDLYADATVAESYLALDDYTSALALVQKYVFDPSVNGFALNNFHRQLARVWRIDRRPSPGPEILALVSAAVLQQKDGTLYLSGHDLQRAKKVDYQAVFGGDRFDSLENYRRGLDRCSCVARIGRSADTGAGSGFVLPGRLLSPKLDDRFLLVTNAHVISEAEEERQAGALHPSEAVVTFAALDAVPPEKELGLAKVLYSSPREQLDVVVAELTEPVAPKSSYPIGGVLPVASSQAPVRLIGHPSGRGLSLSVNQLLDHEAPRLHYRTASEGGSSGSPVFNQEWKLIGLHHAGGDAVPRLNGKTGTYQANEGIWIASIRDAVDRLLS